MKSLLPLCLLATLFFISCNDDDATPAVVTLPPITSEGLNTFGCLINGEPWVAQVDNKVDDELDVVFNPFFDELYIAANFIKNDRNEFMAFGVINIDSVGQYPFSYHEEILLNFGINKFYDIDTTKTNFLVLEKFDTDNQIVSGKFEFTLFRETDTLVVTEGRFDATYRN